MKTKILSLFSLAALLWACSRDEAPTFDFSNYTVDKVVCQAGSNILVADNTAQLDLRVAIYTESGTYTDKYGEQRPRYVEVPRDRWRDHEIRFYVNGAQVTPPYKTGSATPATLECWAEVDGVRSSQSPAKMAALYPRIEQGAAPATGAPAYEPDPSDLMFEVTVEAPCQMPARRIPVIFHIVDTEHNRNAKQELDAAVCTRMIEQWNAAFGRRNSAAPNGDNANLEFVPALKNVSNVRLAEPGINRVYFTAVELAEVKKSGGVGYELVMWGGGTYTDAAGQVIPMTAGEYTWLVNNNQLNNKTFNPKAFWNPNRYLNVWIICDDAMGTGTMNYANMAREYLPTVFPEGVYDAEALPLPAMLSSRMRALTPAEMTMWNTNPGNLRLPAIGANTLANKVKSLRQAGLSFSKAVVTNNGADVVMHMGAYLGLVPNAPQNATEQWQMLYPSGSAWLDDFCTDTPVYNMWYAAPRAGGMEPVDEGSNRVKYTTAAPYYVYNSTNIMEWGSYQTSITPQQLRRIDWVLNNAPGRMMWKDLTAITE
jgi:hypothetical protein